MTIDDFIPQKELLHVGIIPDGCRRWGRVNNKTFEDSYFTMSDKLGELIDYLFESGHVDNISIYLASTRNFQREENTVKAFCKAEAFFCSSILKKLEQKHKFNVHFAGAIDIIPDYFQESINEICTVTKQNSDLSVNLCIAYNPIDEIWEASQKALSKEDFLSNLWINSPLDILIRSGYSNSISNFLPIQNGYSRIFFLNKFFNDVVKEDINKVLNSFHKTHRRFGI